MPLKLAQNLDEENDAPFLVVNLPAIATQDEVVGGEVSRMEGEAICPHLKSLEYYEQLKRTMDLYSWEATMQSNPTVKEGGKIWESSFDTRDVFYDVHGKLIRQMPEALQYLGLAIDPGTGKRPKDKKLDYSCVVAMGMGLDGYIYIDCVMEKTGFTDTIKNVGKLSERIPRVIDLIGIESNGFQGELRKQALRILPHYDLGCGIFGIKHSSSKHYRIISLDPLIRTGLLKFVSNPDCHILVDQFKDYPPGGSGHDDGPDCVEMATNVIRRIDRESERIGYFNQSFDELGDS